MQHRVSTTTLSFLAGIAFWWGSLAHAADVLIEDVTIISAERSAPAVGQHVLIRSGRIAQISASRIDAPAAVARLSGKGKYLVPGLMDSHVHLGDAPGLPRPTTDPELGRLREAFLKQQPRSYLYFGVTQVLDLIQLPDAIKSFEAQPQHPDLFYCGAAPALNGYPTVFVDPSVRYSAFRDFIYEPANAKDHPLPTGMDAAAHTPKAVVDRIAAAGARCVKVFIETGFGAASNWPVLSLNTLRAVRAAAREHGLLVVAHANSLQAQRVAVQMQADVITHGLWNWGSVKDNGAVPAEIGAHLKEVHRARIGYQPTVRVIFGLADLFRADTLEDPMYAKVVPPALLEWYGTPAGQWYKDEMRREFGGAPDTKIAQQHIVIGNRGMRAMHHLHELGHPLLLGSDTPSAPTFGNQPGYDTYRELRAMAQGRVPLKAILDAATINNAKQFGIAKDYGTVEVGKIANLLLLEGNPLETVRAWTMIDRVILHGEVIRRESLAAR